MYRRVVIWMTTCRVDICMTICHMYDCTIIYLQDFWSSHVYEEQESRENRWSTDRVPKAPRKMWNGNKNENWNGQRCIQQEKIIAGNKRNEHSNKEEDWQRLIWLVALYSEETWSLRKEDIDGLVNNYSNSLFCQNRFIIFLV